MDSCIPTPASAPYTAHRVELRGKRVPADAGLRRRFPIEEASWIWHPEIPARRDASVRFTREWDAETTEHAIFHVTADQRYVLFLDGQRISMGPDRSDLAHWAFTTLHVTIRPGHHRLDADVHWLTPGEAPGAQITLRGGFLFKAEQTAENLDTGAPGWRCAERKGFRCRSADDPDSVLPWRLATGADFEFDGAVWCAPLEYRDHPAVVGSYWDSDYGIINPIWSLESTPLPEQLDRRVAPGRVRAAWRPIAPVAVPAGTDAAIAASFEKLIGPAQEPWTVAPHDTLQLVWDLGNYYCGYPHVVLSGGKGSAVMFEWAEALHTTEKEYDKGNRDEIVGKYFRSFGDKFLAGGGEREEYGSFWWRAGRYIRIAVRTGDEPLTIRELAIDESRHPVENESEFSAEPSRLAPIVDLAVRGIQMCSHETFMDCPYYEQLLYVGDGRLEAFAYYAMSPDIALPRRVLQLFAWSQGRTGFIAERYPSDPFQLSLTYSAFWVNMIHDYLLWRNDAAWVKANLLIPMRGLMENFIGLLDDRDIYASEIPGWSFVDWVPGWSFGNAPTAADGISATVNYQIVYAFRDAAAVERAVGEEAMAARYEAVADRLDRRCHELFWDEVKGLFAETTAHDVFTEHAQCMAVLSGSATSAEAERCARGMMAGGIAQATVYFSFYVLELYARLAQTNPELGTAKALADKLAFWEALADNGFKTPVEMPEPSRSDCHAWGSHPLFHFHASIAGIRPAETGFKSVEIRPLLNLPYDDLHSRLPHPMGSITVDWRKKNGIAEITVSLPVETPGALVWAGERHELAPGATTKLTLKV